MLILSVTIAFLTLGVLWLAAILNEHDMHPMRRLAELMKRPAAEIALVALVAVGLIHHGATKTNVNCKMENVKLGDAPMIVPDSTETGILHFTFYTLHSNGVPVVAGTITAEDCEAGYVLSTVRTDETHSFDPPPDAVVCDDWLAFGAARDWFTLPLGCWALGSWLGGKVSVNSCGLVETLPGLTNGWIAPLAADLGIVPEANWQQILHFTPYTLHSLFWHCLTPSNTLQMTWVNALLDRAATNPVSFQCEVAANGDVTFRYDLSALAEDVISNVTVGVSCGGGARCLGQLSKSVTSLRFARIDPFDAVLTDRDGDGISTVDEVFLHHTDPGNPDTDFDGLSDSDELFVWHTDPTNPHALRPDMPDGMAVKIGGENPWAYPEDSTNSIWQHVFYSGTTNGAFAYPQPTEHTAVLRVSVGDGERRGLRRAGRGRHGGAAPRAAADEVGHHVVDARGSGGEGRHASCLYARGRFAFGHVRLGAVRVRHPSLRLGGRVVGAHQLPEHGGDRALHTRPQQVRRPRLAAVERGRRGAHLRMERNRGGGG